MHQPPGFIAECQEDMVCLLKKSLYGLKQSPTQWYLKFDSFIISCGFNRSRMDHCVYVKHFEDKPPIYLLLYVDDMLLASRDKHEIRKLKEQLKSEFEMKELGSTRRILGIDIKRNRRQGTLSLSQELYSARMLSKFNMNECKPVSVPLGRHFKLSAIQSPQTDLQKAEMTNIPYAPDLT